MDKETNIEEMLVNPEVDAVFKQIEQELGLKKPLCPNKRRLVLERFGTVHAYREKIIANREEREKKRQEKSLRRAVFRVALQTKDQGTVEFECPDDEYILDRAELEWDKIYFPYSCRAGACSTCVGKIIYGSVDQSDQSFLPEEKIVEGWVLTCVAYPTSDCKIQTEMEEEYYAG